MSCPYCLSDKHSKPKPECETVFSARFSKIYQRNAAQQVARERSMANDRIPVRQVGNSALYLLVGRADS